jgi:hypothetical protein
VSEPGTRKRKRKRKRDERGCGEKCRAEQGSNAGSPQSALIGGFIVSVTVLIYFSISL